MSAPRFTPGPWAVDRQHVFAGRELRREVANGFNVSADQWHGLACVFTAGSDPGDPRGRANAHLIAAAPDLYEALEAMMAHFEGRAGYSTAHHKARAALAKARGETP